MPAGRVPRERHPGWQDLQQTRTDTPLPQKQAWPSIDTDYRREYSRRSPISASDAFSRGVTPAPRRGGVGVCGA